MLALAAAPFAAQAETINIYGWQNYSWEFVDIKDGRSFDRISGNAANIGFAANVDTGMNGIHVTLQCESWALHNHWHGNGGWCTRNSKIGLSHPQAGEIMFATWLLPYNEAVAQWIDPFYDAGSDSHTSIMGGIGGSSIYHSPGYWGNPRALGSGEVEGEDGTHVARDPRYAIGLDTGFNRRQEEIIQYFSPNWNGFKFRFAWTAGYEDENSATNGSDTAEVDPIIRSASLVYENGPLWLATTWQDHEDWTASRAGMQGKMTSSDAESIRLAGRYIFDLGDGMSISLAAMWEDLEYEFNNVSNADDVMAAFYLGPFATTYDLYDADGVIQKVDAITAASLTTQAHVTAQKTLGDLRKAFGMTDTENRAITLTDDEATAAGLTANQAYTLPAVIMTKMNDPLTVDDESMDGNDMVHPGERVGYDATYTITEAANQPGGASYDKVKYMAGVATAMHHYLLAAQARGNETATGGYKFKDAYDMLVADARTKAIKANEPNATEEIPLKKRRAEATAGQNMKVEREAWLVSGKIKFGGPLDFRFSYMDADDLEVSCGSCGGDWDETAADAWNVGLFYTMPAGTELRLTYSEVDNDDNGTYGQGISGTGLGSSGAEIEMFAIGIVHWFD